MSDNWKSDDELKEILQEGAQGASIESSAESEKAEAGGKQKDGAVEVKSMNLQEFADGEEETIDLPSLDMLHDISLEVKVVLASVQLTIEEVMELHAGSIISLDKLAGEPVEVVVEGQVVARGETVILHDKFGVLITEIVQKKAIIKSLEEKIKKAKIMI